MKNSDHSLTDIKRQRKFLEVFEEVRNRDWVESAACRNTNINFFPNFPILNAGHQRVNNIAVQRNIAANAIAVCEGCPVKLECQGDHKHEREGVFFGTVPLERFSPRSNRRYFPDCRCIPCRSRQKRYGELNA